MYNPQIQNKIRHFIANQPSNCLNQYSSTFSLELIDSFPQLSPAQIRSLCKAQEQLVYTTLFRSSKKCCQWDLTTSTVK